jgi:hypothetical protein
VPRGSPLLDGWLDSGQVRLMGTHNFALIAFGLKPSPSLERGGLIIIELYVNVFLHVIQKKVSKEL